MCDMSCYEMCLEHDPLTAQKSTQWVYAGEGRGSYASKCQMEFVGESRGEYNKAELTVHSGYRLRPWVYCCCLLLPLLVILGWYLWPRPAAAPVPQAPDCFTNYEHRQSMWDADRAAFCCATQGRGCPQHHHHHPHVVYVRPPPVIHHVHHVHHSHFAYNCHAGYSNWYFGWSEHKKGWCCDHQGMGCPGTWHGSYHISTHMVHGVGHAHGKIYDCHAGFSNWMQGWSDSKKDWCCQHSDRGCQKFHCTGETSQWASEKRTWCCSNFQKACPRTTLSPDKCDAVCTVKGEDSKCIDRIQWVAKHVYGSKDNHCALAYSKIQVECDICRGCSIQDAGCEVQVAGKDPFDCNAALNNFFRAWSAEKKHWCCTERGKGCEGSQPPAVDAGAGMVWKHVQVNGYWTWQAVHGHGVISAPYDCHAGLNNWHIGWSGPKKSWCCEHQQLGCGGGAGAAAGGAVFHHYHTHSHGAPPGPPGAGMSWQWEHHHWAQEPIH